MKHVQEGLQKSKIINEFISKGQYNINPPNVSQGENYNGLPYLVLDYPAIFKPKNILAFRTMFWWGHFFSFTLHIQGEYFDQYADHIQKHWQVLANENVYISVGKTPWDYHYQPDNYRLMKDIDPKQTLQKRFLKLSRFIPIDQWPLVSEHALDFYQRLIKVLDQSLNTNRPTAN